ncbi:unnamed protein product [Phytophthora fragariaefolia]|uniref:Unnamed protein product n=1 Tax=Phytophthora fragariaefolia TaxID=1490495 RepID=A0A9W6YDR6_9STRA|nr:unnamed protein product [Phytophthora fragariaefolia]
MAIALHEDGLSPAASWGSTIRILPTDQHCRYLGIQLGSTPGAIRSWTIAGGADPASVRKDAHSGSKGEDRISTATTVNEWALHGSLTDHIIGDVLHPSQPTPEAPRLVVTPSFGGRTPPHFTVTQNLWRGGVSMVDLAGAKPLPGGAQAALPALYQVSDTVLSSPLEWHGELSSINIAQLITAATALPRHRLRHPTGLPLLESVPHLEIRFLIPEADGSYKGYSEIPKNLQLPGTLIRNVVCWTYTGSGHLRLRKSCSGATHSGNLHISATCTNGYIQVGHMQCGHYS